MKRIKPARIAVCGVVMSLAFLSLLAQEASGATPGCPDHQRIVFQSNRDGNYEIYSMKCGAGIEVTRLTNDPATDFNPVLSHDGSRVAFVSDRNGPYNIFVMNADGSGVVGLTTGQFDVNPTWSPNDQEIAYSGPIFLTFFQGQEIVVMNADGSGKHTVTHTSSLNAQPDWSPDGKKILFNCDYHIAVMNRDGTGFRVLTNLDGFSEWPHWSPDGKRIVFHSAKSGHNHDQIYVMHADGTEVRRITPDSANYSGPVWSPSGKAIAFASDRDGDFEIYTMGAGGRITRLTNNSADDSTPSWGQEED